MSFRVALKPSYTVPVTVQTPKDNGGFDESKFKARFKNVSLDELRELKEMEQRDVMLQVLVGFEDLLDDQDLPLEYNSDNLGVLLAIPQALLGLSEAFWGSIYKGKVKN